MSFLNEYFASLLDGFLNPQKRLFVGYIATALFIALGWLLFSGNKRAPSKVSQALAHLFSKKVWWSKSAKLDYQIILGNRLFLLLFSPLLISQLAISSGLFLLLAEHLPSRPTFLSSWNTFSVSLLFTSVYFVIDDFARFLLHFMMHRLPFLWAFHKVHHSAETMTPFTVLRTHPVEMVLFSLRTIAVQSISIALFVFFLGDRLTLVTVFSASLFAFIFNLVGANLRHSHIPLHYPKWLERLIISPAQHQIHHSIESRHHDKNFGVALSFWDRCFGSFLYSEPKENLNFGLKNQQHFRYGVISAYSEPFFDIYKMLMRRLAQLSSVVPTFISMKFRGVEK